MRGLRNVEGMSMTVVLELIFVMLVVLVKLCCFTQGGSFMKQRPFCVTRKGNFVKQKLGVLPEELLS